MPAWITRLRRNYYTSEDGHVTGNTNLENRNENTEPIEVDGEEAKSAKYETTSAIGKDVSKSRYFALHNAVLVFLVRGSRALRHAVVYNIKTGDSAQRIQEAKPEPRSISKSAC
jgi:hypothetical protein